MKRLLFIIIGLCALTLTACEVETEKSIDLLLVSAEVELECIAEKIGSGGWTDHTILCSGKVGGFNGEAWIKVNGIIYGSETIVVAGSETSFSFTIQDKCPGSYTGTPQTFSVTIYADVDGDGYVSTVDENIVFQSSVVIIL